MASYDAISGKTFQFPHSGIYLDAAFTHPMSVETAGAVRRYLDMRSGLAPEHSAIVTQARETAIASFARLHGCDMASLAFVPSTMAGENAIVNGLGLNEGIGRVVTDAHHFFGSLFLYDQLRQKGLDVALAMPAPGQSLIEAYDEIITPGTTLVALSAISATTGYVHDLKAISELAHSRGALVYADLIQAAGALPLDLSASGIDFASSASYKWLMGDFGVGFFYCRPEATDRLRRCQTGYRQMASFRSDYLPYGAAAAPSTWPIASGAATTTAALVEVGTQNHAGIVALGESLPRIEMLGLEALHAHRTTLIRRLHEVLPTLGLAPVIGEHEADRRDGTIATFTCAEPQRYKAALESRGIRISVYSDRIRISPSMFNTTGDIEALIEALK